MAGWLPGTPHSTLCFWGLYWKNDTPAPKRGNGVTSQTKRDLEGNCALLRPLCFYWYHPGLVCHYSNLAGLTVQPFLTIPPFDPSAPAIHAFCPLNTPSSSH